MVNLTDTYYKFNPMDEYQEYIDLASDYMHKVFDRFTDDIENNEKLSLELVEYATQALLCLNKAEELDTASNHDSLRVLAWKHIARIYLVGMKDYSQAQESVINAIKLDVEHDESLYELLAEIEYASGDSDAFKLASEGLLEIDLDYEADYEIKEFISNFEFDLDTENWTSAGMTCSNLILAYKDIGNKKQVKKWMKIKGVISKYRTSDPGPGWWGLRKIRRNIHT